MKVKVSDGFRAEMWDRWKAGQGTLIISTGMGVPNSTVHKQLQNGGGIAPRERYRSRLALQLAEREEIWRGICSGESIRGIARRLRRSASSISREIRRHGGKGGYRAAVADVTARSRTRRPMRCLLGKNSRLANAETAKLMLFWSPMQISCWLARQFRGEESMQVSHETIYRTLYIQSRGVLKKELQKQLRRSRSLRRNRLRAGKQGQILDGISISERPAGVEDRAIPGHWEGDLICGKGNSHIATLVERRSRFVMLVKLTGKDTQTVVKALTKHVLKLPKELCLS